jgi:spoIIIJ-associated protein
MSYIDVTGKSEDEAVRNGLAQLGLDRDDVSVEILERAKTGFLGLGSNPAKVRLTYEGAEESVKSAAPQPAPEVKKAPAAKPEVKKPVAPAPETKSAPVVENAVKTPAPVRAEECTDENAEKIRAFLSGLLTQMETSAVARVYLEEAGRYQVILEGDRLGALIGRRGETLDAIQQLTSYAVNHSIEKRIRIHVDAENYREKREKSLESLALKVAGKVKRYHRSVTLEPMNAYERHVIHTALQEETGVTTYSVGTEPNRRVIVAPDGQNRY